MQRRSILTANPSELLQNFLTVIPRYVVTRPEKVPVVQEAISSLELTLKPEIIVLSDATYKEIMAKGSHVDPYEFKPPQIEDPSTHVFANFFTSGTSGRQKAALMIDYRYIELNYIASQALTKHTGLVMFASQIYWATWFTFVVRCIISERPLLFFTETGTIDLLNAIHKYKPTTYFGSPGVAAEMQRTIAKYPGRWDTSSLQLLLIGGDSMRHDIHKKLSKELNVLIHQMYSSTETGTIAMADVDGPVVYGSAGKPTVPIRLVDPDTEIDITEPNTVGEVRLQHPIAVGYRGDPIATAEAFDDKGWFRLGDLAYLNESNDLFLVGRIKDMLKYKGLQAFPNKVEDIIKSIPGMEEVAVTGKKDPEVGDLLTAFVVKTPGSNITDKDIEDFLAKQNLHELEELRGGVIFVKKLPKNSNGKLVRGILSEWLNGPLPNIRERL